MISGMRKPLHSHTHSHTHTHTHTHTRFPSPLPATEAQAHSCTPAADRAPLPVALQAGPAQRRDAKAQPQSCPPLLPTPSPSPSLLPLQQRRRRTSSAAHGGRIAVASSTGQAKRSSIAAEVSAGPN